MSTRRLIVPTVAFLLVSLLSACGGGDSDDDRSAASRTAKASSSSPTQVGAGEKNYQQRCQSCHQLNGEGTPGVFPPLAGSEYVTSANVGVPIRIVLHGLQGPITVKGTEYNSLMPAYGVGIVMSDSEVAAVLTYVRSSWGNNASAVTAEDVEHVREESEHHTGAMTAADLKPLMRK